MASSGSRNFLTWAGAGKSLARRDWREIGSSLMMVDRISVSQ